MESFFHTLKTEFVMHCDYKTRDDARISLFDYMEVFYNGNDGTHRFTTRPRYRGGDEFAG
jgi:Integrase core domain